nr:3,4-dihydroxy-2-butanone-4-phosphate synthase [Faecalibaculum rodentium]
MTDDPQRENEGDLIAGAKFANQETMNFMATHGKGLICLPLSEQMAARLHLTPMTSDNTDNHKTAFTVSVDHVTTSTGISAQERAITAKACADSQSPPGGFSPPWASLSADCKIRRRPGKKRSYGSDR